MKLITAIIKPNKVESVKSELSKVGISGITLTEVKGFGRQKGHKEVYRGTEIEVSFLPKSKLEIAVKDEELETVINAIQSYFYSLLDKCEVLHYADIRVATFGLCIFWANFAR